MDILINESDNEIKERELELKNRQIENIPGEKKLRSKDITKIVKNTNTSIFDLNRCCLWNGYITRSNNKGSYINFYFKNKKKTALHRLIYANFKESLGDDSYIRYTCENKGVCCNIHHMVKYKYEDKEHEEEKKIKTNETNENFKIVIY